MLDELVLYPRRARGNPKFELAYGELDIEVCEGRVESGIILWGARCLRGVPRFKVVIK